MYLQKYLDAIVIMKFRLHAIVGPLHSVMAIKISDCDKIN